MQNDEKWRLSTSIGRVTALEPGQTSSQKVGDESLHLGYPMISIDWHGKVSLLSMTWQCTLYILVLISWILSVHIHIIVFMSSLFMNTYTKIAKVCLTKQLNLLHIHMHGYHRFVLGHRVLHLFWPSMECWVWLGVFVRGNEGNNTSLPKNRRISARLKALKYSLTSFLLCHIVSHAHPFPPKVQCQLMVILIWHHLQASLLLFAKAKKVDTNGEGSLVADGQIGEIQCCS